MQPVPMRRRPRWAGRTAARRMMDEAAGVHRRARGGGWADAAGAAASGRQESGETRYHLRALRALLIIFAGGDFAAPAIRKSSCFLPDLSAADNHRGFNPRPAQVSLGFSGLRYLGTTDPFVPRTVL